MSMDAKTAVELLEPLVGSGERIFRLGFSPGHVNNTGTVTGTPPTGGVPVAVAVLT